MKVLVPCITSRLSLSIYLMMMLVGGFNAIVFGEELEATDIIASVDGNPVYVGELNLILAERFPNQPIDSIDIDLKRATCHVLA